MAGTPGAAPRTRAAGRLCRGAVRQRERSGAPVPMPHGHTEEGLGRRWRAPPPPPPKQTVGQSSAGAAPGPDRRVYGGSGAQRLR